MNAHISRRDFLRGSLATAGLTLAASVSPLGYRIVNASEGLDPTFKPNVWFEVTPDGLVTVAVPNSEMGQGVRTALPMIVADELEADWKNVRILQAPAAEAYQSPILHSQVTVASASCRGFYEPLRKAGATGRAMLITAAAQTWKVPEGECEAFNGAVKHKATGRTLSYGDLCRKAAKLPVPAEPRLKKESEFRYLGKPMARVDIPEKVAGRAVYGLDVNVPDMLYAAIARPPSYGARPASYDEKAAQGIKGVRNVVPTPNGIAVVADTIEAAWQGRDALRIQWGAGSHPDMDDASIERQFLEDLDKQGVQVMSRGEVKKALAKAAKTHEAVYYVPFVAHSTMEPMNATAHVQADRCDIWAPTQNQTLAQMMGSKFSELPPEKVHVHTTLLGCGFGRRDPPDFIIDAVSTSKAVGMPVKVVWTREEDFKYDFYRAATAQRIRAGLDSQGHVTGWSHKVACTSILRFLNPAWLKDGIDIFSLWGIVDFPDTPALSNTAYAFPNFYVEQFLSELPIPACPWRSVQNAPNAFVVESFVDELAHASGKDPVEFRMHLLQDNMRVRRVLETVAEKAGWGNAVPKGKGRGVAQHTCFGGYLAHVADISVDEETGKIKVDRVVVAVDVGPVINPDPLVAQVEGAVVMGISTALKEQVHFAKGGVATANFDDYRLLRMSEVPEIEVHIIKSTEKIGGIGEPGVPPTAPAIANAFFNATGVRVRRLPLDPKTVLGAIKKT